ncbi:tetratricopeptide repeat protein [Shewanella sp. NIFS-20-20]|uniref:tetratricopeptide repeat protein n=1 Tax=Shewanella sp. NIFS-20-20 TaxID=2853806 RepID=UPI001C451A94|nr:tetratricopeptide repeat protein [Shewanella sp. NIFS-20-20]MBV7316283.1 sel1 repeat family protein [Shewanella sp. NIFS-20-20]
MQIKPWFISVFFVGSLTVAASVSAFSIPQPQAENAATKVAFIQLNAKNGDAEAQFLLGLMSISGRFVHIDKQQGIEWLQRAAAQNHPKALQALADLYYEGSLVPRDLVQALNAYQQLVEQGNPLARFRIGLIYAAGGEGVTRDCRRAVDEFSQVGDAVSLGNVVWILSTCPEAEHRDGARALALGLELLKSNQGDPSILDNLAAAYAEMGDFGAAVKIQQQAIDALEQNPQMQTHAPEFRLRLISYLNRQAHREALPLK